MSQVWIAALALVMLWPASLAAQRPEGAPIGRVTATQRMPTSVTGITVTGTTTVSANVSWQPVSGAVSYSVLRISPASYAAPGTPPSISGLTTTTWTDFGQQNAGFVFAGVYRYVVTALLEGGTTVSGQVNWTRPDPSCAPPGQPVLTLLNPIPSGMPISFGVFPSGAAIGWYNQGKNSIIAYRVERSQGGSPWMLVGTSCGEAPLVGGWSEATQGFADQLPGIAPNLTYQYRVTAIAANGRAGEATVSWQAPSPVILNWLPVTIGTALSGKNTLSWRYEPPAVNAPIRPVSFRVTTSYGLNQTLSWNSCQVGLCSLPIPKQPGTHQFTVTAEWRMGSPDQTGGAVRPVLATTSATTTIVIAQ